MRTTAHKLILPWLAVATLMPATSAWSMDGMGMGGGPGGTLNPAASDVGTTPEVSVYGASLAFGKRWDAFRLSASIPYYVVDSRDADTENGLGDVRVVGEWDVLPQAPRRFSLTGSFLWKIPTADENKGLGTGETDYGAFAELGYTVGGNKPFVAVGYIRKGDTPTIDFRDTWLYSLGVSHYAGADEVYVSLDTRQNVLPGFEDTRLLSAGWLHSLSANQTLRVDGSVGLNDASPDALIIVELVNWF